LNTLKSLVRGNHADPRPTKHGISNQPRHMMLTWVECNFKHVIARDFADSRARRRQLRRHGNEVQCSAPTGERRPAFN